MAALVIWLLIALAAPAQTRLAVDQIRSIAFTQLIDFAVDSTPAEIRINRECSLERHCSADLGGTVVSYMDAATIRQAAGTGTIRIGLDRSGSLAAWREPTVTTASCSGLVCGVATGWPPDTLKLSECSVSSGTFGPCEDKRAALRAETIQAGPGLLKVGDTLQVDPAVIAYRVGVPASSSAACLPGSWAVDANWFYVCVAADTWRRAALGSW